MDMFNTQQLFYILPEIILLTGATLILVVNLFLDEHNLFGYIASQLLLVLTFIATFYLIGVDVQVFHNSFVVDNVATYSKLFILLSSVFIFQYSKEFLVKTESFKNEYFSLMLLSILGMMIMSSGSNLITLYLGLEIMSLALYSIIAMANTRILAIEAALKYFILGAIASGVLLYGMSLIYGTTGSLDIATIALNATEANPLLINFAIIFLIIGIAFKFGAVPFHMWIPDVYQGANLNSAMFLSSVPKIATGLMFIRIITEALGSYSQYWGDVVLFIGVASVIMGSVVALIQTNIKRLLGYSAISNIGFVLAAFSLGETSSYTAAMYYLIIYSITTIAAFGALIAMSNNGKEISEIKELSGLFKHHPLMSVFILIVLFSMAGVPPMIGFFAKLAVLQEVVNHSHIVIATILVVFSVVGAYYYLRILKFIFFDKVIEKLTITNSFATNILLAINVLALLIFGIFPEYVTNIIFHNMF